MGEKTKQVTVSLPFDLAAAVEVAAAKSERSLAAQIRLAVREHLGDVEDVEEATAPSGFSKEDAADLGVTFMPGSSPGRVHAELNRAGQ
jgi:hypothetical protein